MRRNGKRDKVVVKPSSYRPSKKELEEVYKVEEDVGQPIENFGETEEEQFGNLVGHLFRQVKVRQEK